MIWEVHKQSFILFIYLFKGDAGQPGPPGPIGRIGRKVENLYD